MRNRVWTVIAVAGLACCLRLAGGAAVAQEPDVSLKMESRAAVQRALARLVEVQQEDGSWRGDPAITGLVVTAMVGSGEDRFGAEAESTQKALDYIRGFAREDGGIFHELYANYTTSICAMALVEAGQPQDAERIQNARKFLLGLQADESEDIQPGDEQYGGWGYEKSEGDEMHRADMSNTQLALEALHAIEQAAEEDRPEGTGAEKTATELAYDKALAYLQECQNDDGGFVYRPTESKAGESADGGLRSYGSMTYAGLKSMVYARVDGDDPRVKAAFAWASAHWSVEENPGVGQQGLYYYYQTMSKALRACGEPVVVDEAGERHVWREELVGQLLKVQREDGTWANENGRWMEQIPELVTAYSVLAIEHATQDW